MFNDYDRRPGLLRSSFMSQETPKKIWRMLGYPAGVGLTLAAVWFASGRVDHSLLQQAEARQIAFLIGAVAANLLLTSALFWLVTRSFDAKPPVPLGRMFTIISASGLLNYLGLQAGSIGRVAYLKVRNGLSVRQSVTILVIVAVLTVLASVICVAVLAAIPVHSPRWGVILALMLLGGAFMGPVARRLLRRHIVGAWAWLPLRTADLFVTSLRVWAAFAAVGHPILYPQALAMAAGVVVVNLLSFTPNGLGLREWSVAAMAGLIAPALGPIGVLATLLDRAVEAVVLVVFGGASMWSLQSELRKQKSKPATTERA